MKLEEQPVCISPAPVSNPLHRSLRTHDASCAIHLAIGDIVILTILLPNSRSETPDIF